MRSHVLRFLLLFVLLSTPWFSSHRLWGASGLNKRYSLPFGGQLEMSIPSQWREVVSDDSAEQLVLNFFSDGTEPPAKLMVAPQPVPAQWTNYLASLRTTVRQIGQSMVQRSVEQELQLREFRLGGTIAGYLYRVTDAEPAPGGYEFARQGAFIVGDVLVTFTILTNRADEAIFPRLAGRSIKTISISKPRPHAVIRDRGPLYPIAVEQEDELRYGFIDRRGTVKISPRFFGAKHFVDGIAPVEVAGGRWGAIDTSGAFVVTARYRDLWHFKEGFAVALSDRGWGHVDLQGNVLANRWLPNRDAPALLEFHEKRAAISDGAGRWGFIDETGAIVIERTFRRVGHFAEGKAPFLDEDGTKGYLDRTGRLLFRTNVFMGAPFSEGLAVARHEPTGRFGYINGEGRFVIAPQFDHAHAFSNGLAAVVQRGLLGYIDTSGRHVVAPKYRYDPFAALTDDDLFARRPMAFTHRDGRAAVMIDGRWGYISSRGELVIDAVHGEVDAFQDGLAAVREADGQTMVGYLDVNGTFVWRSRR